MMTSDVESQIIRVIGKLENAQPNLNLPTTNETQEGNYRLQKKIAGILNQANINNISSFQNDLDENPNDTITEKSNSFSEAPSETMEPSFHKPNLKRRPSIILDLNKIINIGEYKIELGKLLNILDKKLPDSKESNLNNDISKNYSQCSTEGNERRKSFLSPEKHKVSHDDQSGLNSEDKENSNESSNQMSKDENSCDDLSKDKKFDENLSKKYHKIALLLKVYMNENKLINEMNKQGQKEICPNNNCRRRSLFDMSSYIIPSEASNVSYGNKNQLPNFVSKFFKSKKGVVTSKRKKRNSMVSGRLCNKLKKLNQQLQSQNTSKKAPQSEKAEFRIKEQQSDKTTESNIKFNESRKKSISEISNFDSSHNADCGSIIDNENSVYCVNEDKRGSMIFSDGLSAVKKRRQSDFFDVENAPQQQEEITGFHKMISTIIEEEDNNTNNNANPQNNGSEKKENNVEDEKEKVEKSPNENADSNKENNQNENYENEGEESGDSDYVEEEEEDTILDDDYCYNDNNISTSLCFDDCIF